MIGYQIGSTFYDLDYLENLDIVNPPKATIPDYKEYEVLGDGIQHGKGWIQCEWRFAFITIDEIEILRGFCEDKSSEVYVTTLMEDGDYGVYSAMMHWPHKLPPKVDYAVDFVILFTDMVYIGEYSA